VRVLVIPDIHLKAWIFDLADKLLRNGKADKAVCLMDIPDDWGMEYHFDYYNAVYDRAIAFAKSFPDTLWCYGNHDLSYKWKKTETGYSIFAEPTVLKRQQEFNDVISNPANVAIVHRIGNVIFSHGGLVTEYIRWLDSKLVNADLDKIIQVINRSATRKLWVDASPLWLRGKDCKCESFRGDEYIQVVGHTPVERILEDNHMIYTDVFSTYRDGRQIGRSEMMIIDTETKQYYVQGISR
jgi:hypothetical protein